MTDIIAALLKEMEWSGTRHGIPNNPRDEGIAYATCPQCGGFQSRNHEFSRDMVGHSPGCRMAKAIEVAYGKIDDGPAYTRPELDLGQYDVAIDDTPRTPVVNLYNCYNRELFLSRVEKISDPMARMTIQTLQSMLEIMEKQINSRM
jgi:hypothetical protein